MSTREQAALGSNHKVVSSPHSFLIQVCNLCAEEMVLDKGDVLYGDSWYHGSCWLKADGESQVPNDVREPLIIIDE